MTFADPSSTAFSSAAATGAPASPLAASAAALNPALVTRFHALVEEVTDGLMQGNHYDRAACRADAITLLMASSRQMEPPSEPGQGESPLMYLLQMEQQKALGLLHGQKATAKKQAQPVPAGPTFYVKA